MTDIVYREADLDDLSRIVDMKIALFEEAGHADLLTAHTANLVLTDYRKLYELKEAQHFVAVVNSEIVACVGAFLKSDIPFRYFESGQYGFIGDVYTERDRRNVGVATELNRRALLWLKNVGVPMVRLLASDAGRSIYKKLGFSSSDEMVLRFTK